MRDNTKEKLFATLELSRERTTSLTIVAQKIRPDIVAMTASRVKEAKDLL